MSQNLDELLARHRELDEKIKEGYTDYLDDTSLSKMKQEKLHIKDQIERLKKKAV